MRPRPPCTVLVVDARTPYRSRMVHGLDQQRGIEVVAAICPSQIKTVVASSQPSVVALGLDSCDKTTLAGLTQRGYRVVVFADHCPTSTLELLAMGASALIIDTDTAMGLARLGRALKGAAALTVLTATSTEHVSAAPEPHSFSPPLHEHFPVEIVAIGASTGGTQAISKVLRDMPESAPPVLIVQHMPAGITHSFAQRLNTECRIKVCEAEDGQRLQRGLALVCPGNYHMTVKRIAKNLEVRIDQGPLRNHHRPSVDVLFASVATVCGDKAVGVLLTGMGADGARGLRAMRELGATTLAQDEASCAVFGMPRQAIALGAVEQVVPLTEMAAAILNGAGRPARFRGAGT